jgi:RNA polymerase sigma-70 factor (ECF subfamily)
MVEKGSPQAGADELDTIRLAQKGERAAVARLFGKHLGTVHRFALRMCRDEERARDVAQESLLTALDSLQGYRGEASFSTWLFTIARSHCVRQRRRAEREAPSEQADAALERAASVQPEPDSLAAHEQLSDMLERALGSLDPEEREVVLLRDVEGLAAKDAAEVLGLSVPALKSRLHRARAGLRERVRALLEPRPEPARAGCPDVVAALSSKLEGDLSELDCAALERHLEGCPDCASRCESVRAVLRACASLRDAPHAPVARAVLDAALEKRPR